jgi:polyhydroxyalkanoate synthesis regulator phasin
MSELDMVERVFLLGIYKKEPNESLDEVIKSLVNTGMFDIVEAKEVLAKLKKRGYIAKESLSMSGLSIAMKTEAEFKLL